HRTGSAIGSWLAGAVFEAPGGYGAAFMLACTFLSAASVVALTIDRDARGIWRAATVTAADGGRARRRRIALGGRRYTARNAALNRRMLVNPAANATADIGSVVSSMRVFARCTRRVVATAVGDAPAWRRNNRRR